MATVDDFIQRFSGKSTIDDREAAQYMDRFASTDPRDREFDNDAMYSGTTEYLGKLPEPEFQQAAQNAYATAAPQQQQSLAGTLMRALQGRGVDLGTLLGGRPPAPGGSVSPDQYAHLANFARRRYPDAMQDVVREQPWFVKAMGNPVVMGALGMVASRMIRSRTRR